MCGWQEAADLLEAFLRQFLAAAFVMQRSRQVQNTYGNRYYIRDRLRMPAGMLSSRVCSAPVHGWPSGGEDHGDGDTVIDVAMPSTAGN